MDKYYTVKTEKRAHAIISDYVDNNDLTGGSFKKNTCECECGETNAISWYNGDVDLFVGVCDCCGDDDDFIFSVLNIRK